MVAILLKKNKMREVIDPTRRRRRGERARANMKEGKRSP